MKDLSEAQLIDIETRARDLVEELDVDINEMPHRDLQQRFTAAFEQAESVAEDVIELCEHLRAFSLEAQKAENAV